MDYEGWTQYLEFYALKHPRVGTIRIAAGDKQSSQGLVMMWDDPKVGGQRYWDDMKTDMNVDGYEQHMTFWVYPDNPSVTTLQYKLDKANLVDIKPKKVHSTSLVNTSPVHDEQLVMFDYDNPHEYSWNHPEDIVLAEEHDHKVGIPTIVDGEWQVVDLGKYDYQLANTVKQKNQRRYNHKVRLAPNQKVDVNCYIQEAKMEVPYEFSYVEHQDLPIHGMDGMWSSTQTSPAKCEYVYSSLY